MMNLRLFSLLFVSMAFSGCATWSKHNIHLPDSGKFRIALLPIQSDMKIKRLKHVLNSPNAFISKEEEKTMIKEQLKKVEEELSRNLEEKLTKTGMFEVISNDEVLLTLEEMGCSTETIKLSRPEIISLGNKLNSQALLSVNIGGYGKVKKKWIFWLILTGLPEAAIQGVITAEVVGNQWAAIGVASEEVLSEIVQWGGGAFLFNRIFTPVILDAHLSSSWDGKTVWRDTSMATINYKALRKLPKTERKKREVRLHYTSEKTLDHLVNNIVKSAKRNAKR